MTNAIRSYLFARQQQKMTPIDACTDAATFHGVDVYALAAALRAADIDAARLSII
jgi:S-adenosylmethionine hydrolase